MTDTIRFTCPQCTHTMQLPTSTVGKQGKCPSCSAVITITASQPAGPSANQVPVTPQQPSAAIISPQPVQRVQQQAPAAVTSPTPQPASEPRKSRWKLLCITHILTAVLTIGLMPYWKPHLEPFFPADYLAQDSTEATTPEPEVAAAADIEGPTEDDMPSSDLPPSSSLDLEDLGPEESSEEEDDFPSTPRPDPLADMNLVIDIIVLNCAQSYDNVKMEFELVNRSKVLLSYVGVNGKFMDLDGAYLGKEFTNDTNVRGGKSVIMTFNLENVQVDEIGSWELSFSAVNIDLGDGRKREAVTRFKLNEILGSVQHAKKNEVVLENELAGHWQADGSDNSVFLSPRAGRYTISNGGEMQKFWVIKRDYARRQVVARRQFERRLDIGNGEYMSGIEMTYVLDDTSSIGVMTSGFLGSKTGDRWLQVEVDDLENNTRIDDRTEP